MLLKSGMMTITGMADIGDINIDTNVITTKAFNNNFYIRPTVLVLLLLKIYVLVQMYYPQDSMT